MTYFMVPFFLWSIILGENIEPISDEYQAIMDAEHDAKQADAQIWTLVGCGFGIWGIAAAQVITPAIPPTKLLGKSPEYVSFYTETYQQKVKSERTKQAAMGCLISGASLIYFYGYIYPKLVQSPIYY